MGAIPAVIAGAVTLGISMNIRILCCVAGILAVGAMQDKPVPVVDHHQHLYNPALGPLTLGEPVTADDLVKLLDQAGIRKAVLFSIAYQFGNPNRPAIANEYEQVQQENDRVAVKWRATPIACAASAASTRSRTMRSPRSHAARKTRRCGSGSSCISETRTCMLDDPRHVAQLREVFRAANDAGMAIVAHLRSTISQRRPYGAPQARVLSQRYAIRARRPDPDRASGRRRRL